MTSEIEGDVRKNLLDRSDAEKVFRPWWDTMEDYLLNSLIALGIFKKKSFYTIFVNLSLENLVRIKY